MTAWITVLLSAVVLCKFDIAAGDEAWLLVPEDQETAVGTVDNLGWHPRLHIGSSPVYGVANGKVVFISHKTGSSTEVLEVMDIASGRIVASWPLGNIWLARQLSGPSAEVRLTEKFAYYLTIRKTPISTFFEFNQIRLDDGTVFTLKVPDGFSSRIYDGSSQPLFCVDERVVVFNDQRQRFEDVVPQNPTIVRKSNDERPALCTANSQLVFLPSKGVFRLSKGGGLDQVLKEDFSMTNPVRSSHVRAEGAFIKMFTTGSSDAPMIGTISYMRDTQQISIIDPETLSTRWSMPMPERPVVQSAIGAHDGAIYLLVDAGDVIRMDGATLQSMWKVPFDVSQHTRILLVTAASVPHSY